jgi:hypothetical protein
MERMVSSSTQHSPSPSLRKGSVKRGNWCQRQVPVSSLDKCHPLTNECGGYVSKDEVNPRCQQVLNEEFNSGTYGSSTAQNCSLGYMGLRFEGSVMWGKPKPCCLYEFASPWSPTPQYNNMDTKKKGLVSRVHNELLQFNNKKLSSSIKKTAKDLKKICKLPISIWKDAQSH